MRASPPRLASGRALTSLERSELKGGSSPSPAGSRGSCTWRAETRRRAISSSRCTRVLPKASRSRTSGARARYSASSGRPRPAARDTAPPRRRAELFEVQDRSGLGGRGRLAANLRGDSDRALHELRVRRLLGALTVVIVTEPDGEVAAALEYGVRSSRSPSGRSRGTHRDRGRSPGDRTSARPAPPRARTTLARTSMIT